MLKTMMISTALSGLLIGGALAQTTEPASPAVKDAERAATSSPSMPGGNARFINSQSTDQWLSSNFIGVDVVGPDNEKIGDITDILFEKNGNVVGYVVGVGGFLGIGAKDVAIPFDQVQWSEQPMVTPAPAPSGGTGASGSTAASSPPAAQKSPDMYPDHGKITMTKEQLTSAPAVTYAAR